MRKSRGLQSEGPPRVGVQHPLDRPRGHALGGALCSGSWFLRVWSVVGWLLHPQTMVRWHHHGRGVWQTEVTSWPAGSREGQLQSERHLGQIQSQGPTSRAQARLCRMQWPLEAPLPAGLHWGPGPWCLSVGDPSYLSHQKGEVRQCPGG